ncbi:ATP-dependent RNA helicase dbp6 [Dissophora globulifera]|nr:ATP-dependent RNA helicase dbp6 [Dissophora globulifera]
MFNIKRYDIETEASQNGTPVSTSTAAQERLAKLNARLKKNKGESNNAVTTPHSQDTHSEQHQNQRPEHRSEGQHLRYDDGNKHSQHQYLTSDAGKKAQSFDINTYKRSREQYPDDDSKKYGKKWEKRAKELKDSDLVPNDVRLAMKAEAEVKVNDISTTTTVVPSDGQYDDDNSDNDQRVQGRDLEDEFNAPAEQEIDGVRQFMDDASADAALAELAALVPLPTFEAKEISAEDMERAKSMGIPDWLAHPTKIEPETNTPINAAMFGFSERLIKQCRQAGIEECFAVQTAVIPVLMRAKHLGDIRKAPGDLCVSAPTGSGKTLAYVLPIIEILSQRVVTRLRALVVLPTRDLCVQVKETFDTFVKGTDLKIATSTGQNSFAHEQHVLVGEKYTTPQSKLLLGGHSRVDVLITTPGRLIDHIKSTPNFTLQHLRFLVIDEADRLLNQSFQDWLHHILTAIHPSPEKRLLGADGSKAIQLRQDQYGFPIHDAIAPGFLSSLFEVPESDVEDPKVLSVQKLLFSATLTRNPAKIASLQLSDPQYVAVQEGGQDGDDKQKYTTPAGLTENMIVCESSEKPLMVLHLLHHLNVRSALCFTKSVESAHRLYKLVQLYEKIRTTSSPSTPSAPTASIKELSNHKKVKDNGVDDEDNYFEQKDNSDDSDDDSSNSDDDSSDGDNDNSDQEEDDDVEMEHVDASTQSTLRATAVDMDIDSSSVAPEDTIVVAEYSSDLPKSKRQSILRAFNKGEIHLLICSDLISRGMDLSPVSVVINYDTPVYMKKYIHRVGRTARAGKSGTAYSLVEMQEARHFKEMITKAGHWEKISRIKVKDQEVKDLVPGYTKALAGLKEALVSSARAGKKRPFGSARNARK